MITRILQVFGIYTFAAVLFAVSVHVRMLQRGEEWNLWLLILDRTLGWWIWALFTPAIVYLARRVRLARHNWWKSFPLHLLVATVMGILQISLAIFISILLYSEPITWEYFWSQTLPSIYFQFPWALLIYALIVTVAYYLDNLKRLRDEELTREKLVAESARAHLAALKQQLRPHFLFNSLNSVIVLMQKGEVETATEMLERLSELLREVLTHEAATMVSLGEEVEFVRKYLSIEKIRFAERLEVEIDFGPETLSWQVPAFILQPFAENTIKHAVAKSETPVRLRLHGEVKNQQLILTVADDGRFLAEEVGSRKGGSETAIARLNYLYGEDATISSGPNAAGGYHTAIAIPVSPRIAVMKG